ncbi:MAG TPA: hypothetical protein G4O08_13285 [Anaerolineae bacterium]|nr:hypothetical protein [Anaerolineae bacterium]
MKILPTDHNLSLVDAMMAEMEPYLLSGEVFWPLESRPPRGGLAFPRLTLGGLLLTLDQLEAVQGEISTAQVADLRRQNMRMDQLRFKHAVALENKAAREAGSRLNLWRAYIGDLEEMPGRAGNYAYEVRHRVMLTRLETFGAEHVDFLKAVSAAKSVDRRLRRVFKQEAFIWDERLQQTYPPQQYWYLYGQPRMKT